MEFTNLHKVTAFVLNPPQPQNVLLLGACGFLW